MSRVPRPSVRNCEMEHSTIEPNTATLLLGSGPSRALQNLRSAGDSGSMIISGTCPEHIRNRYGLHAADIVWLSDQHGGMEETMGPGDLEHRILSRALKHMKGGGSLLLEDIEYLSVQRGFDTVARFVKCLSDAAPHGKGRLSVVADPKAFSKQQMGNLGRLFDRVVTLDPDADKKSRLASLLLLSASYLLDGMGEVSYRYVSSRVEDREVVCVTTVPPMRLSERHGFPRTDFIWLTEVGSGRNMFRPEKLGCDVQRAVMRRLSSGIRPVVFLDALDQLLMYVDFAEVLRFVKNLIDASAVRGGTVIATANLEALDQSQRSALARRFDLSFRCD
jgi:hypothetical protein